MQRGNMECPHTYYSLVGQYGRPDGGWLRLGVGKPASNIGYPRALSQDHIRQSHHSAKPAEYAPGTVRPRLHLAKVATSMRRKLLCAGCAWI